jgi:hypothetical protein
VPIGYVLGFTALWLALGWTPRELARPGRHAAPAHEAPAIGEPR